MDRLIVDPSEVVQDTDILGTNKNMMLGLARLCQDMLGAGTSIGGALCAPGTGLSVVVGPGSIYSPQNVDNTPYGSIPADTTHQIIKQGIQLASVTLATPAPSSAGQSINYLIEGQFQELDGGQAVVPYYNSSNPLVPFQGPLNNGLAQPTVRQGIFAIQAKAGVAAATGSQVTPAVDAGWTVMYVVTVDFGESALTTADIVVAAGAPFIGVTALNALSQALAATLYLPLYAVTAPETAAGIGSPNTNFPPYDVRRYGAVGDGVTNDSAAFNLAGTIGLPIFVPDPPVSWLLNANVAGVFQSISYPKTSGAGTISIRNLGASDQDAIETAVAALESNNPITLDTYGDSTMWGADPANLTAQVAIPPYQQLQNFVNTFLGNSACTVSNHAISGTTLQQMLNGTDGSGLTFAARVAASAASVVFCNHGVNDAFGPNSTSAAVYRAGLLAFIRIVRVAGKTPVLVTPHPCLTIGGFGSQARAENTARFAKIMRDVAQSHGVILVDNNAVLAKIMQADNDSNQINANLPLSILADGVHGPQATYLITGSNLADAILGAQVETFSRAGQRIGAARANINASGQSISPSTTSRLGAVVNTGSASPQTLRALFRVADTGFDISMLHPIYSLAAGTIAVSLDGTGIGALASFSQLGAGFTPTNFLQDVETVIARNVAPGFHQLILTTSAAGVATLNGLRARNSEKPVILGSTGVDLGLRSLIAQKFELPAGATSNVIDMMDYPCSRFIDGLELEWTGQLTKNSGLAIVANTGSNTGAATPQQLLIFGLNNSGFAAVSEATGPAAFVTTPLDATDHSTASHVYRVIVTAANPGTAQMFVDDVSVGTVALTQPYFGGWLGVWKNLNTDQLLFTNISRVWRF